MNEAAVNTERGQFQHRWRWRIAFVCTCVVAVGGFVCALQQFTLKFLWDQSAHTRTLGGVLFMSIGVLGITLPLILARKKKAFSSLPAQGQWALIVSLPVAYVTILALCGFASLRSTALILPRPFTSTAVVHYDPSDPTQLTRIEFHNALRPLFASSNYDREENGGERFKYVLHQGYLRFPRRENVVLDGWTEQLDDGTVRITLDVNAKDAVQFRVDNLEDVTITHDAEVIGESVSRKGRFQITIVGRPRWEP